MRNKNSFVNFFSYKCDLLYCLIQVRNHMQNLVNDILYDNMQLKEVPNLNDEDESENELLDLEEIFSALYLFFPMSIQNALQYFLMN